MLFPLLALLLPLRSVCAAPIEPSVLSIPVRDIVAGNLSHHEPHPSFKLYARWLETRQGSYVARDPKAVFEKHSNVISVDCHSDHEDCFFTSKRSFTDITKSRRDLDKLNVALEEQMQARDSDDPAALALRDLQKRGPSASNLLSSVHWKTYHDLGPDQTEAGFQHYIVWDLKCQTVQFSSSGFQLTSHNVIVNADNSVTAILHATLVTDEPPESTPGVTITITFSCGGIFTDKCCLYNYESRNYIGSTETYIPKKEPMECVRAQDVSGQNCDSYHGGWCGVHITQYQKNEGPGIDNTVYRFDVFLYDSDQELVGEWELAGIPDTQTKQFGSTLPYTFGVTAPTVDSDAVYMSYNDQSWGSNDQEHQCSFGAYDSGHRDGDCGFSC